MACWKLQHWMIFTLKKEISICHMWLQEGNWRSDTWQGHEQVTRLWLERWELRINMWPSATKISDQFNSLRLYQSRIDINPHEFRKNNNAPLVTGSCRQLSMEGLISLVVVDIHKREISSKLGILWYTVSPWSTGLSLYHVILCILFVVRSGSSTNLMVKSRVFSLRASQIVYLDPRLQLITRYPRHWNDYCTTCF